MAHHSLRERLLSRLIVTEAPNDPDVLGRPLAGPCLIWTGAKDPGGYGRIGVGKAVRFTHRIAYELLTGEVPPPVLDHLCRIPSCAAPDHLEPVTQAENIRRGEWGRLNRELKAMTHCYRGHEFTPENTYVIPATGSRQCLTCKRDGQRARYDPAKERERKWRYKSR